MIKGAIGFELRQQNSLVLGLSYMKATSSVLNVAKSKEYN